MPEKWKIEPRTRIAYDPTTEQPVYYKGSVSFKKLKPSDAHVLSPEEIDAAIKKLNAIRGGK